MILAIGLPPRRLTAICALRIARVWIFTKSGIISPRRTAAQAEHRVLLVQRLDRGEELLVLVGRAAVLLGPGDLDELLLEVRQELVERRVDEADDDRQAVHRLEDALEVALLERLELGHRRVEGGDRLAARRRRAPRPAARLRLGPGRRRSRRGSRRARSRAARPRGTCARCGTGRCPARRSRGPARPPRACRRSSRPASGGCSSAQPRIVWSSGWSSKRASTVGSGRGTARRSSRRG